jgi:hypothetical protein
MTQPRQPNKARKALSALSFPFRLIWVETFSAISQFQHLNNKTTEKQSLEERPSRLSTLRANREQHGTHGSHVAKGVDDTNKRYDKRQYALSDQVASLEETESDLNRFQKLKRIFRPRTAKRTSRTKMLQPIEPHASFMMVDSNIAAMAATNPAGHESIWSTVLHSLFIEWGQLGTNLKFSWLTALGSFLWMCLPTTIVYRLYERICQYFSSVRNAWKEMFPLPPAGPFAGLRKWARKDAQQLAQGKGHFKYAFAAGLTKFCLDAYDGAEKKRRRKSMKRN